MADGALYTGTVGAKNLLQSMRSIANNLANINSVGFYADYETLATHKVKGSSLQTRILPLTAKTYTDFKPGPILNTGRELDVAVDGPGFIAVQNKKGEAGFTRNGSFNITPEGFLVTQKGDLVLGLGGVITIPPASSVSIDRAGVISARLKGEAQNTTTEVGRIKVVELAPSEAAKGEDGLYYPVGSANIVESPRVKLLPGALEGSNVDAIRSLTELIELSRQFDMHTKQMKAVEENATKANRLLDIQG
jgi:flagellar basal-body rod protein FlgF